MNKTARNMRELSWQNYHRNGNIWNTFMKILSWSFAPPPPPNAPLFNIHNQRQYQIQEKSFQQICDSFNIPHHLGLFDHQPQSDGDNMRIPRVNQR